jgi:hypothetical protein
MKLLGHSTPKMTLLYAEVTQTDLQREFHLVRSHPRHLMPPPKGPASASKHQADLPGVLASLQAAQHVLEMFRRTLPDGSDRRIFDRLANRITKILSQIRKLDPTQK